MAVITPPKLVGRVAAYGATFGPPQLAIKPEVLHTEPRPTPDSRDIQFQRENYRRVAPETDDWPIIWGKVVSNQWGGFSHEDLVSIQAPILIAVGDHDYVRLEHAVESVELIPHPQVAVTPDASHFVLFSGPEKVIPVIKHFLEGPEERPPFATPGTGNGATTTVIGKAMSGFRRPERH